MDTPGEGGNSAKSQRQERTGGSLEKVSGLVWPRSEYAGEGARDDPGEVSRGQIKGVILYVCKRV